MIQNIDIDIFIKHTREYDLIIDARSPSEFDHSHIPKAVNYYALNDEEHQEIGTAHKQISPFEARSKGAAYVCKNAVAHIKSLYDTFTPSAKIAIYCARGGMRSSSLATIFSSIGYRIDRVIGGYKSYRTFAIANLESFDDYNFITLAGHTGCGKSELLGLLDNVIDLEGMANHYGSVFGAACGKQPSQKEFQNRLLHALLDLDRQKPAFIEAESKKIGQICIPSALHDKMSNSFRVEITAPLEQRVERIMSMYAHIDESFFMQCMERITPYIKHSFKIEAIDSYHSGDLAKVSEILLVEYYDKVYKRACEPELVLHNENPEKTVKILQELQKEKSQKQK